MYKRQDAFGAAIYPPVLLFVAFLLVSPQPRRRALIFIAGAVLATLMQRRGMIIGSQEDGGFARVDSEVPLAEMFGYAMTLRSATQGKAEFTMEFSRYMQVPANVADELVAKYQEQLKAAAKK